MHLQRQLLETSKIVLGGWAEADASVDKRRRKSLFEFGESSPNVLVTVEAHVDLVDGEVLHGPLARKASKASSKASDVST